MVKYWNGIISELQQCKITKYQIYSIMLYCNMWYQWYSLGSYGCETV